MAISEGPIYLDASVLASFQLEDAFSDRADAILSRHGTIFVVSDLCIVEVSSVAARKVRMGEMTAAAAMDVFARIDDWIAKVPSHVLQMPDDLREANQLIRLLTLGLRTQDAIHIAMTRRLRIPIATFDVGLAKAAREVGVTVMDA